MKSKTVKFRLKKNFSKGKCRLDRCRRSPRARGICEKHAQHLRFIGEYENFAAPEKMLKKYKLKRKKTGDTCIIFDCKNPRRSRGICSTHYWQLKRRGIYEEFALKNEG